MAMKLSQAIARLAQDARTEEDGQAIVEYSLILAFIAVAVTGVLTLLSGSINSLFESIVGSL